MNKFIKSFPEEVYLECKILLSKEDFNVLFFESESVRNIGFVDRTLTDLKDDDGFVTYQGIEYCVIISAFGNWFLSGSSIDCNSIAITEVDLKKLMNGESIRKYGPMD